MTIGRSTSETWGEWINWIFFASFLPNRLHECFNSQVFTLSTSTNHTKKGSHSDKPCDNVYDIPGSSTAAMPTGYDPRWRSTWGTCMCSREFYIVVLVLNTPAEWALHVIKVRQASLFLTCVNFGLENHTWEKEPTNTLAGSYYVIYRFETGVTSHISRFYSRAC